VIDLHGRLDQVRCLDCSAIEARSTVQTWLETHNSLPSAASLNIRPDGDADLPEQIISDFRIPQCSRCNGALMPDVVFFGGTVPKPTVEACYQLIDASQGMMVLGSSLSVYSGLRFCRYAAEQGKPLIILNEGQTRADDLCWHKYDTEPFSLLAECAHHLRHAAQEPLHG
jgi:NAD-dependent SIR2 family protein deacetylase